MRRQSKVMRIPLAAMALALLAQAWTAFAQEPPPPPPPPPAAEQPPAPQPCVPSCRAGYTCVDGRCLSPCNPPCPDSEVCTRNGLCLPATEPVAPRAPALGTTALSGRSVRAGAGGPSKDTTELRDKFSAQRAGGAFLIILSVLSGTASGLMVGLGDSDIAMWGSIISPLELAFGIPGITLVVTGSTGLGKLDKGIPITQGGPRLHVGAAPALTLEF
ncbi:MAG: hypothetical protein PHU25_00310 [Deltaproteobacteria bacterium]|nr:hypothetical protein [Deltaproteobacteria bacterium]